MSETVTNTTYNPFLKKYYIGKKALFQMDSYKTPLIGMIKKDLGAGGSSWEQTIGVSNPVGGSAVIGNAFANSTAGVDAVATGGYKKRFASVLVQDFTIKSSRNEDGGIEKVFRRKIDGLKSEFLQTINYQAYRGAGGALVQLAAVTGALAVFNGTCTATDSTKSGMQFIKTGKILNSSVQSDGTLLQQAGGTTHLLTVTGRNVSAGTFTYTATAANAHPSGSAYIYEDGTATLALCGLDDWCPATDTLAATSFKGLTRSQDVNALGGLRIPGVGETIQEVLIDGISQARALTDGKSEPDMVIISPKRFVQLQKDLGSSLVFTAVKGKKMVGGSDSFGFKGIEVTAGGRPVIVLEDPACQTDTTWILESNSLYLRSMGQWPFVPQEDGNLLHLLQGTDTWQSQLWGYMEIVSAAPGHITRVQHDAAIA